MTHPEPPRTGRAARIARGAIAHYEDPLYYDAAYRRRKSDVRFYREVAQEYGGPILELGVGTGRVALDLVKAGHEVTGVDCSKAMLSHARSKAERLPKQAQRRLSLRKSDLRTVRLPTRFRLVIAPFNVFMHLYTLRDVERTLATARRHLSPRGRLVFDVINPDLRVMSRTPDRLYRARKVRTASTGDVSAYYEAFEYDAVRQVQMTSLIFQRAHSSDLSIVPLSQRQFFPQELSALLHYNGFAVERCWGDFERGPLDSASESQVWIARAR